jgi:hypothetical protein
MVRERSTQAIRSVASQRLLFIRDADQGEAYCAVGKEGVEKRVDWNKEAATGFVE